MSIGKNMFIKYDVYNFFNKTNFSKSLKKMNVNRLKIKFN